MPVRILPMGENMKKCVILIVVCLWSIASISTAAVPDKMTPAVVKAKGCNSCHEGIEDILDSNSAMMPVLHKNDLDAAYRVFLFNHHAELKPLV